jgi:putative methionine-R-sulfoxide reductase with GAF domain
VFDGEAMSTLRLRDITACFQGVIPAVIATSSKEGEPNITYLSQVYFIDDTHVALSCQFFNKTKQNVAENPYANVQVTDPVTNDAYQMDLRFDHSETSGPLFDTMFARIEAIASHTGMAGVFKLISADVYEVSSVWKVEGFHRPLPPSEPKPLPPSDIRSELRVLQVVSDRLNRAPDLEALLSSLLAALRQELGFEHAMILLADDQQQRLFTVASAGYGESGVGAEVAIGVGLIGTVAQSKKVMRISDVGGDLRYGRAIRGEASGSHLADVLTPEIPLPGLPDARSHLGIPLSVQDRLVGVLAVESKTPLGIDEWHEAFLDIVGNQVAIALERMLEDEEIVTPKHDRAPALAPPSRKARALKFYEGDDCVFVDGEYLIRNVPARILWRLLESYQKEGRVEFTNRELRLDASLGLPPVKDNLESRLILLRKRLEEKCPDIRIPSCGRGHFRLEIGCGLDLSVVASGK